MAQPPTAGRARSRASYGRPRVILVAGEALYDLNDTATTEIYTLSLTTSSDLGGRRIIFARTGEKTRAIRKIGSSMLFSRLCRVPVDLFSFLSSSLAAPNITDRLIRKKE